MSLPGHEPGNGPGKGMDPGGLARSRWAVPRAASPCGHCRKTQS